MPGRTEMIRDLLTTEVPAWLPSTTAPTGLSSVGSEGKSSKFYPKYNQTARLSRRSKEENYL
jgi:hypothetical protein